MPTLPEDRLAALRDEFAHATNPATSIERWLSDQTAYAAWELERVRANRNNTAAESRLNAAYNRAARNWNRARKELQSRQSARTNHVTRLTPTRARSAASAPLADPAGAPQPKPATRAVWNEMVDLIEHGAIAPNSIAVSVKQGAR